MEGEGLEVGGLGVGVDCVRGEGDETLLPEATRGGEGDNAGDLEATTPV